MYENNTNCYEVSVVVIKSVLSSVWGGAPGALPLGEGGQSFPTRPCPTWGLSVCV